MTRWSSIIRLALSPAGNLLLTVNNSSSSHGNSFHFLSSWLCKLIWCCAVTLITTHCLFHWRVNVFLNISINNVLTISPPTAPSSPGFPFFLITLSTLFLRSSLSLLKRFYFNVKSKIIYSRFFLVRQFSNKSVRYL